MPYPPMLVATSGIGVDAMHDRIILYLSRADVQDVGLSMRAIIEALEEMSRKIGEELPR